MTTRLTIRRPGRAAAAVGAAVAVSATALMAMVAGTASADEPGRCVENVNVRSEPDMSAPIVVVCEAGSQVAVAETRNGFVHLTDLDGWAAQEFVSVNGRTPPAPASRQAPAGSSSSSSSATPTTSRAPGSSSDSDSRDSTSGDSTSSDGAATRSDSTGSDSANADSAGSTTQPAPAANRTFPRRTPAPAPAPEPAPAESGSPVGGLLG